MPCGELVFIFLWADHPAGCVVIWERFFGFAFEPEFFGWAGKHLAYGVGGEEG